MSVTTFNLGWLGVSRGVIHKAINPSILGDALSKFRKSDFGTLAPEDKIANEVAIKYNSGMVMCVYEYPGIDKFWIITHLAEEQTYTTVLLPEEY